MRPWELPDRRSVAQYLQGLSDERLTDYCLKRLAREQLDPQGSRPDAFDERCENGHLRSVGNLRFRRNGTVVCRDCARESKIRAIVRHTEGETRCHAR